MLPDFPDIKRRLDEELERKLANEAMNDPLLSRTPQRAMHEGHLIATGDVRGTVRTSELEEFTTEFSITPEELVCKGTTVYHDRAIRAQSELQAAIAKSFYSTIRRVSGDVGNGIEADGKPFSKELFLEALAMIEWDFHDDGTHNKESLMLVVNPAIGEFLKTHAAEWESDPEFTRQHKIIEAQKRKEWSDRESHRRLVD